MSWSLSCSQPFSSLDPWIFTPLPPTVLIKNNGRVRQSEASFSFHLNQFASSVYVATTFPL